MASKSAIKHLLSSSIRELKGSPKEFLGTLKKTLHRVKDSKVEIQWIVHSTKDYTVEATVLTPSKGQAFVAECFCSCPDGLRRKRSWPSVRRVCKHAYACLLSVVDLENKTEASVLEQSRRNNNQLLKQLHDERKRRQQELLKGTKKKHKPDSGEVQVTDILSKEELGKEIKENIRGEASSKPNITETPFFLNHIYSKEVNNKYSLTLKDIFHGDVIEAFVTNYMWDIHWFFHELPHMLSVPFTLVHGMSEGLFRQLGLPSNIKTYKPPLPEPYGTHHTKMATIFYPTGVRVAVFTSNLIPVDWKVKAQGIWLQDFPLKSQDAPEISEFERDLIDYIRRLGGPAVDVASRLSAYDFSGSKGILIPSVPGKHGANMWSKYGHMKLRTVLLSRFVDKKKIFVSAPCIAQFSSLGSLTSKYIKDELLVSLSSSKRTTLNATRPPEFKAIWPSVEFVRTSLEGYAAGNCMPCNQRNIKPFLINDKILHVYEGIESVKMAPPHIKTYTRYNKDLNELSWILLTSTNLSKAAWGAMINSNQYGRVLHIRSYELGVLLLPQLHSRTNAFSVTPTHPQLGVIQSRKVAAHKSTVKFIPWIQGEVTTEHLHAAGSIPVPLPYQLLSKSYLEESSSEPWVWDKNYSKPDVHGAMFHSVK